jgi:hypothetical protein
MSQLSNACYTVWAVTLLMAEETLRMIYFSYVHSIIPYWLISGGIHCTVIITLRFKNE